MAGRSRAKQWREPRVAVAWQRVADHLLAIERESGRDRPVNGVIMDAGSRVCNGMVWSLDNIDKVCMERSERRNAKRQCKRHNAKDAMWQQNDNVPFEQSRNVPLTPPRCGDAGRTNTTDDPSRPRPAGNAQEGQKETDHTA